MVVSANPSMVQLVQFGCHFLFATSLMQFFDGVWLQRFHRHCPSASLNVASRFHFHRSGSVMLFHLFRGLKLAPATTCLSVSHTYSNCFYSVPHLVLTVTFLGTFTSTTKASSAYIYGPHSLGLTSFVCSAWLSLNKEFVVLSHSSHDSIGGTDVPPSARVFL